MNYLSQEWKMFFPENSSAEQARNAAFAVESMV